MSASSNWVTRGVVIQLSAIRRAMTSREVREAPLRSDPTWGSQLVPARVWRPEPQQARGPGRGREPLQLLDVGAHILQHDPATASAAAHAGQVDAQVSRQLADRRGAAGTVPGLLRSQIPAPSSGATGTCCGEGVWMSLSRLLMGRAQLGGRRGPGSAGFAERKNPLPHPQLVAGLHEDLCDRAGSGGWNGRHRLFVFQLKDGLVFVPYRPL